MPRILWPSSLRSLSFAVTTATCLPLIGERRMNRWPAAISDHSSHDLAVAGGVAEMNTTDAVYRGRRPGHDERLFGLVNVGTPQSATMAVPFASVRFIGIHGA